MIGTSTSRQCDSQFSNQNSLHSFLRLLVAAGIYRTINRPVNAFDSIINTGPMKKYLKPFHGLYLRISKKRYNDRMAQQVKKPYSLKDLPSG